MYQYALACGLSAKPLALPQAHLSQPAYADRFTHPQHLSEPVMAIRSEHCAPYISYLVPCSMRYSDPNSQGQYKYEEVLCGGCVKRHDGAHLRVPPN